MLDFITAYQAHPKVPRALHLSETIALHFTPTTICVLAHLVIQELESGTIENPKQRYFAGYLIHLANFFEFTEWIWSPQQQNKMKII